MPNTLIHIAIQTPISRTISPKTEIPWLLVGAIIPDIPWIFQRILLAANIADPYLVKLYFTAQASLLFSLLLCLTVSTFAHQTMKIFIVLAVNSLLHLLLDATQVKWGTSVHLLAPLNWQTINFGVVWPENILGYIITFAGLCFLCLQWRNIQQEGVTFNRSPRISIAAVSMLFYLALPFTTLNSLETSNSNYLKTLRNHDARPGQQIEIDRSYYSKENDEIILFSGEPIRLTGVTPPHSGIISIKGIFISPDLLDIQDYHIHNNYRDIASMIGLGFSLAIWIYLLFKKVYDPLCRQRYS